MKNTTGFLCFLLFSRCPLCTALIAWLFFPCLLFRLCCLLPAVFSCLTNVTSALLDFALSVKFGLNHTGATLGKHFSACSLLLSVPLYQSSLQRLEILFVGCCALKRQPKGFTVQRQGEQKHRRKKAIIILFVTNRKLSHGEIRQNTKEQPTLGDELTPSKTQFSGFTMQSILPLLNLQLFTWFWGYSWGAHTFALLPREEW